MTVQILIGCLLLVVTTLVHSLAMSISLASLRGFLAIRALQSFRVLRPAPIALLVVVMFLASVVESLGWALTYLKLGAIEGFEKALYFSTVTYTTLGYGDISLGEQWRLLSAFEAANGVIMFGWSTALIAAAVQRVYFPPATAEAVSG